MLIIPSVNPAFLSSIWCCGLQLATEESKNFSDRNIFITLLPNKAVLQKAQEPPKKRDKSTTNEVSAGVWVHSEVSWGVLTMEWFAGAAHLCLLARFGILEYV